MLIEFNMFLYCFTFSLVGSSQSQENNCWCDVTMETYCECYTKHFWMISNSGNMKEPPLHSNSDAGSESRLPVRWGKPITVDYNGTTIDYARKLLLGIFHIFIFALYQYIALLHALWMLLLKPLFYVAPDLYIQFEGFCFRWLLYLVSSQQYHQKYVGKF